MNTKTAQEIFREKHKDILTSLKELRIRYYSSVVAFYNHNMYYIRDTKHRQ